MALGECLHVGIAVVAQHVPAPVEDDPHAFDRPGGVQQGQLVAAGCGNVLVWLRRYGGLEHDAWRSLR